MAKSRDQLVARALVVLGIGSVGQPASAEDVQAVDDQVDPFLAWLGARHDLVVQDDEAIEDAWFLPLGDMLAKRMLDEFSIGLEEAQRIEALDTAALADLKIIARDKPTYEPLDTEYF